MGGKGHKEDVGTKLTEQVIKSLLGLWQQSRWVRTSTACSSPQEQARVVTAGDVQTYENTGEAPADRAGSSLLPPHTQEHKPAQVDQLQWKG